MDKKIQGVFEFDAFRLELDERRLTRNDQLVQLPPKIFDLLSILVQNPGRLIEKDELLKSLWPGTFVEESNLSVNVSTLRRVLGEGAAGGKYIETVPKRGYRFVAEVRQFASVEDEPVAPVKTPRSRTPIWLAGGLIALLAITLLWVWKNRQQPVLYQVKSLAVLPFTPLTGDDSQQYLGLGMADAVITRLSALKKIEVRPTSAVLKYSKTEDALAAGHQLGVDAIVEGRVQHSDKRIRTTVQVLRVSDGKQIWAEAFDDYFTNVFAVQDAISERIANALSQNLTESNQQAGSKPGTENTEAYRLYLQGQFLVAKRVNEATLNAIQYFQQAVALDPDYATAYAALANALLARAGSLLEDGLHEKAKTAALKALNLDDQLPEAHLAMGQVLMRSDWDWSGAERSFQRAIRLNPRLAPAHASLATLYTALGRHREAIGEMELACKLEPSSASLRSDLAWTHQFARQFKEAELESKKAIEIDPWSFTGHRQLAKAYLLESRFDQAIAEARTSFEINATSRRRGLTELAKAYAAAGKATEAGKMLEDLRQRHWTEPDPSYETASLYVALGDKDSAFRSLEAAVTNRLTRIIWLKSDPEFDPVRSDPRFKRVLTRMGLGSE